MKVFLKKNPGRFFYKLRLRRILLAYSLILLPVLAFCYFGDATRVCHALLYLWIISFVFLLFAKLLFRDYPDKAGVTADERFELGGRLQISQIDEMQDEDLLYQLCQRKDYSTTAKAVAVGRIRRNQTYLSAVLRSNAEDEIKLAAVEYCEDQTALQEVFRMNSHKELGLLALRSISDADFVDQAYSSRMDEIRAHVIRRTNKEALLLKAAKWDENDDIRYKAVLKLPPDSPGLLGIALNDASDRIALAAVQSISRQELLNQLAAKAVNPEVRGQALKGVEDRSLLEQIARSDASAEVCLAAMKKLDKASLYCEFAFEHKHPLLRDEALKLAREEDVFQRLKALNAAKGRSCERDAKDDRDQVYSLAVLHQDEKLALWSAERIEDPRVLSELALEHSHSTALTLAIFGRIKDEKVLRILALERRFKTEIQLCIAKQIKDKEVLRELALRPATKSCVVEMILKQINDEAFLGELVLREGLKTDTLLKIIDVLTSADTLRDIYYSKEDRRIKRAALKQLTCYLDDESFFCSIATSTEDPLIRRDAAEKVSEEGNLFRIGKLAEAHEDSLTKSYLIQRLGLRSHRKHCDGCAKPVSVFSRAGERCPHCGSVWGSERQKIVT